MKIKTALVILVLGFAIDFFGSWMKITHQGLADLVLLLALFIKVTGLFLVTVFLLSHPRIKAFLDYDKYDDAFKA